MSLSSSYLLEICGLSCVELLDKHISFRCFPRVFLGQTFLSQVVDVSDFESAYLTFLGSAAFPNYLLCSSMVGSE